ncbi:MAG: amidohydrolase family protein [Candidatus Tectomicrobia bacterium]|nr:amidohydrolase family protein [Candidatus Tectomicrobia bacterium]
MTTDEGREIAGRLLKNARSPGWEGLRDVLIEDGRIAAVGVGLEGKGASVIDLRGRVLLPGLVDAHTHLDKAFTQDFCASAEGTLQAAIREMAKYKKTAGVEDIYRRAERCLLRFVSHGTTAVRSHVDVDSLVGLRGMEAMVRLRERHRERVTLQLVPFTPGASLVSGPAEHRALLREAVAMGADAVGGVPASSGDAESLLSTVFGLAAEFGLPVDLHVDESDDPEDLTLERVAEKALAEGYEGRVVAGHCCSLAAVEDSVARRVIEKVARARIAVVALPICNLYLQGRGDPPPVRRGVTRVKDLLEAGVNVFCGSDNVQDPFSPYGRADTMDAAWLTGLSAQLGLDSMPTLLEMVTLRPARALGLAGRCGIAQGRAADLLVLASDSTENLVVERPPRLLVLKEGRIVSAGDGAEGLGAEGPEL